MTVAGVEEDDVGVDFFPLLTACVLVEVCLGVEVFGVCTAGAHAFEGHGEDGDSVFFLEGFCDGECVVPGCGAGGHWFSLSLGGLWWLERFLSTSYKYSITLFSMRTSLGAGVGCSLLKAISRRWLGAYSGVAGVVLLDGCLQGSVRAHLLV